jgi:hypothetical protein
MSVTQFDEPIDGFLYSTTLRMLPSQARAHALAQMEVLRKSKAYRCRMYVSPDPLVNPIGSYSQVETQSRMTPGSLIWGISVYLSTAANVKVLITDKCTELPLFKDYVKALLFKQNTTGHDLDYPAVDRRTRPGECGNLQRQWRTLDRSSRLIRGRTRPAQSRHLRIERHRVAGEELGFHGDCPSIEHWRVAASCNIPKRDQTDPVALGVCVHP